MVSSSSSLFDPNTPQIQKYLADMNSRWKMRLYFLAKLPSAFWWSLRVNHINHLRCEVTLPYSWRSQNPFQSIYFAAQVAAAELSTGLLCTTAIKGRGRISMLVTNIEATFGKKANATAFFVCEEGQAIIDVVQKAIDTGEGQEVTVTSVGTMANGHEVSRVKITWSFKKKKT